MLSAEASWVLTSGSMCDRRIWKRPGGTARVSYTPVIISIGSTAPGRRDSGDQVGGAGPCRD